MLKNRANCELVKAVLQRRFSRRVVPTNADSQDLKDGYGMYCFYACEYAYYLCAKMICKFKGVVTLENLDMLICKSDGVGPRCKAFVVSTLNKVEWEDEEDA